MDPTVNTPTVELQGRHSACSTFGLVQGLQNWVAGATLVLMAALALWLTRDLEKGMFGAMGPALLLRWWAYAVGLCGLVLIILAFCKHGTALERWSLRSPVLVVGAILAFAVTVPGSSVGALTIPGLGLSRSHMMMFLDHPISAGLLAVSLIILALALLPTIRTGRDEVFVE
jgi:hypothetical protein